MKKRAVLLLIGTFMVLLTLGVIFAVAGPVLYWHMLPEHPLNVWIVDKTVPVPDYREHKGLMWVLNHNKVVSQKTQRAFEYEKDYFGFFPVSKDQYDIREIPSDSQYPDLIYLTDTYGVYTDDYLTRNVRGTRSDIMYGGLNEDELSRIRKNIGNQNTLIGEFNIASSPTNRKNREALGKLFGVQWSGWKGRYFKDLTRDVEVPVWLVENYEKQHQTTWTFHGPGFALVSEDDQIEVMVTGIHTGDKDIELTFRDSAAREFNVSASVPYYYWFEFLSTESDVETLADYRLDVLPEGVALLKKLGLKAEFPAVLRRKNPTYRSYYFAGDFADVQNISKTWSYYGMDQIRARTTFEGKGDNGLFFWKSYAPMMKKIIRDIAAQHDNSARPASEDVISVARTQGQMLQVKEGSTWKNIDIHGVNLGAAVPGKWFTEFPEDETVYRQWLDQMGVMGANAVRLYTLLPPEFYRALKSHNADLPKEKLWLLQEIWPEENPEQGNYLGDAYQKAYEAEIRNVTDAIHGAADIAERKGRAYGWYTADVSDSVLGILVGRELEPDEVIATDKLNPGYRYQGKYISSGTAATPTEGWLARSCDYAVNYEASQYQMQHPVAVVSWPTLDPVKHPTEVAQKNWAAAPYNDRTSVDISHIHTESALTTGLFGAYHIYPNYPDFMNNDDKYAEYKDADGTFRYGGYLQEFISQHQKYPALVAEFGIATGSGTAQVNPDGLHHGGLTESAQGEDIVRMMKTIRREGYAGGMIFEWMDEWAKKTWTQEPLMVPYDNHVFWHNVDDPEQNYGILAYEPVVPDKNETDVQGSGHIKHLSMKKNEEYLFIDVTLDQRPDFSKETLQIGIDTLDRQKGEFRLSPKNKQELPFGIEFNISVTGVDNAKIRVIPSYNRTKLKFSPVKTSAGLFEDLLILTNNASKSRSGKVIPSQVVDASVLFSGDFSRNVRSNLQWEGSVLHLRIPWTRMGVSDPTTLTVLKSENVEPQGDRLERGEVQGVKSEGLMVLAALCNIRDESATELLSTDKPYHWSSWTDPVTVPRLKDSYGIIKRYLDDISR